MVLVQFENLVSGSFVSDAVIFRPEYFSSLCPVLFDILRSLNSLSLPHSQLASMFTCLWFILGSQRRTVLVLFELGVGLL